MLIASAKSGETPKTHRKKLVTLSEMKTTFEGLGIIAEKHAGGDDLYLHCERLNKQYNLGDQWAVDRQRVTIQGKTFQRLFLDFEDFQLFRAALERGCQ